MVESDGLNSVRDFGGDFCQIEFHGDWSFCLINTLISSLF